MRITGHQRVAAEKKELARQLRRTMTPEERILWRALRNRAAGDARFRRQQVVAGFIVDFYCASARLAIEVDGNSHLDRERYDAERDRVLAEMGIRTLRVRNDSVVSALTAVLQKIREETSPLTPLHKWRGVKARHIQ